MNCRPSCVAAGLGGHRQIHRGCRHDSLLCVADHPIWFVSVQGWEGLADSIVGAVTVFYFALLTNRAFQMTPTNWRGNSVKCVS